MANTTEIIRDYTEGRKGLEETNAALYDAGSQVHLEPGRNALTEEERSATTVGNTPAEANGWGLLDTGTGGLNKVQVRGGRLIRCDCGESYALCLIGGKAYRVKGTALV